MKYRELTDIILENFSSHEIVFLLGTRQSGKTTLSKILAQKSSFSDKQTYFFDFEDKQLRDAFNVATLASLPTLLKLEGVNIENKSLLLFDEIQHLNDPANLLKLLHDHFPTLKIIATGSSSLQIKEKFSDSLSGRKNVYKVEPLSFNEFLLFKEENKLQELRQMFKSSEQKNEIISLVKVYEQQFLQLFEEYLIYGGYPEVVLSSSKEKKILKLDSIATSYIQKDIREIARIDNIEAYNQLLRYLAINTGAQFNLASAKEAIKISSVTLSKYLMLLKETYIVDELAPFFTNKNREISKSKKIFYKDLGVRNLQLRNFNELSIRTDVGALYENYIFNLLEHQKSVVKQNFFYRTQSKSEIDFIINTEEKYSLIEVKSGSFSNVPKAMFEFEKKYDGKLNVEEKIVINRSNLEYKNGVLFLPAYLL